MIKKISFALLCSFLWTACSSPTPTPEDQPSEKAIIQSVNRNSEGDLIGRESDLIFARKWKNDKNTFLMDFRMDGSFVGKIEGQALEGQWNITEDQKTLQLRKAEAADDNNESFNKDYTIVNSNTKKVSLMDDLGQELLLTSIKE